MWYKNNIMDYGIHVQGTYWYIFCNRFKSDKIQVIPAYGPIE